MPWSEKLRLWGYPKAEELGSALEAIGLDPTEYRNPDELRRELSYLVKRGFLPQRYVDAAVEFMEWKPPAWLSSLGIIFAGLGVMAAGAWLFPERWKPVPIALGVGISGYGVYDFLRKVGAIS